MDRLGKYLSLCLVVILAVSSLLIVKSTYAQSTPTQKPTPQEFTLKFIPASDNITHVDSFTGVKTFEIVDKSTIEVKIKNQPFEENIKGVKYYLFYSVNVMGHFSQDSTDPRNWRYYYSFPYNYTETPSQNTLKATNSEYTTISIGGDYPSHAQIDVGVGAMLMHDGQFREYDYIGDLVGHLVSGVVQGEISGSTQTFTIPDHQASSASSPNPTSVTTSPPESITSPSASTLPSSTENGLISMPLLTFIAIIAVFVLVIVLLLLLLFCRRAKQYSVLSSKSL